MYYFLKAEEKQQAHHLYSKMGLLLMQGLGLFACAGNNPALILHIHFSTALPTSESLGFCMRLKIIMHEISTHTFPASIGSANV